MAIRFDVSGDELRTTTHVLNYNAAYTMMFWWLPLMTLPSAVDSFLFGIRLDSSNHERVNLLTGQSIPTLQTGVAGVQTPVAFANAITANVWQHVAVVRESTTGLKAYINATLEATNTEPVGSRTGSPGGMFVGGVAISTNTLLDSRVAHIKAWARGLTQAEVAREMATIRPHSFTSLWGWYPTLRGAASRLTDYSGIGRDWTAGGTLTDEDGPPVSWGL